MRQHLHKVFCLFLLANLYFLPSSFGQIYTMNGNPITDCSGFFMDSGGGANSYGTNENFTTVICSDGVGGTHVQLQFSSIAIGTGETFRVYDDNFANPAMELSQIFLQTPGNPFTLQATAANPTGCLTFVFTSDGMDGNEAGWSADINCIASCQTILSELVSSIPAAMPADTGWIDICPGDRVEFFGAGVYPQNGIVYNHSDLNASFEWNFGDGNTAVGPNVTHVYDEPGGYIVQLKITDQFLCENTNFISQRVRVSTYPSYMFEGTLDETICSGDTINITSSIDTSSTSNVSVFPNEGSFQQTLALSYPLLLPDGTGASYQTSLSFTQFSPGAVLTNPDDLIDVTLWLEHSYGGDLDIELICPDGSSIYMLDYPSGVGSTNFGEPFASAGVDGQSADLTLGVPYAYTFVNTAANGSLTDFDPFAPPYTYTTVPSENTGQTFTYGDTYFPSGEYEPEQSFTNLLGCPLNGDWTIRVQDNLGLDNGWMTEWSMTFADHLYPNLETFTPNFVDWGWVDNPTVIASDPGMLEASPINAGNAAYTFWVLDDFGCLNDTTLHFETLPPTHPDCFECGMEILMQEDEVICEGDNVGLNVEPAIDLEDCITFERFPQDLIGAGNHPQGNPYRSPLVINSINPLTITNPIQDICSVCFSFSTDFVGDISVVLEAPDGSRLPLAINNSGVGGYTNTCFTPTSLNDINSATVPYTGDFQPEGNWSSLIGSDINGEWNLEIVDVFGIFDYGELSHWSITFNNTNEYTYSWTPSAGLSCDDCPTPTASPASTTNYQLVVEDIYGCTLTDEIEVAVIADLPEPMVSCSVLGSAVQFDWGNIVGVTEYEYNIIVNGTPQGWMGPLADNTLLVSNLMNNDMVSLEVRPYFSSNANNCPIPVGSSSCIAEFCTLVVDAADLNGVSCFGESDGSLQINVTDGVMPFSYRISGDPNIYTDPLFDDLSAGNYTYTVFDGDNCELNFDIEITTPDSLFADAAQTFVSCFGLNESQAEVIPGGGSGADYTYQWDDSQNAATATNLGVGNVSVLVMDGNGCSVSASTIINELTAVQFQLNTIDPTCNGFNDGTAEITQVSGGLGQTSVDYTYTWSDSQQGTTRMNLEGGVSYTVTVADAQGCEATETQLLQDPIAIAFSIQTIEPSCFQFADASAEVLNIVGPNGNNFNIQWDMAAGNQQTAVASGLTAGSYGVVVEDDLGCLANQTTTIAQPEELIASFVVKDNECFGYSSGSLQAVVNGGSPNYTYSWSGGTAEATFDNLLAGDYTVTITDSRGCEIINTATVSEPASLVASADVVPVSCFGERDGMVEVITEGGTPPFQYSLDNNLFLGSSTLIGLEAGEYTVTIRDVNGCEFFTSANVPEPAELLVDAGMDLTMVYGDSVELVAVIDNAQGLVDVVWSAPYEGTLSCNECEKAFASPDFTIDYEVYVIDENGCIGIDMIRVFVDKPKLLAVPTGFTPNGDNQNDVLIVHGKPGTMLIDFQVYDRWGEMVYQKKDFPVNSPTEGWNGEFRNSMMNSDVYVWYALVLHEDGTEEVFRGQTTLIR